jgi:uncharacterized membrane protein YdjX (TVP38/TMEM64 family)
MEPLRLQPSTPGVWGAPLVVLASVIESLVVFLLSRHALRPKVRLLIAKRPLLRAIDAKPSRRQRG